MQCVLCVHACLADTPACSSKILVVVLESQQAILVDLRRRKTSRTNGASTSKEPEPAGVVEVRHELKWCSEDNEGAKRCVVLSGRCE